MKKISMFLLAVSVVALCALIYTINFHRSNTALIELILLVNFIISMVNFFTKDPKDKGIKQKMQASNACLTLVTSCFAVAQSFYALPLLTLWVVLCDLLLIKFIIGE